MTPEELQQRDLVEACRALVREVERASHGTAYWSDGAELATQAVAAQLQRVIKVEPTPVVRSPLRQTHTNAGLAVSPETFGEVERKLRAAGYDHAFSIDDELGHMIDMHGVALVRE